MPQALTDADLDDVVALEANVQSFPWTRGNFADALAAGYGAWTLRRDGRLAGFCILMFAPDVAHLLVIAVARDLHRQGLGSLLLDWCEQQARERSLDGVLLEVRPSNTSAVAFYKDRGYLQIGLRRGYYPAEKGGREDALVMQKRLDTAAAAPWERRRDGAAFPAGIGRAPRQSAAAPVAARAGHGAPVAAARAPAAGRARCHAPSACSQTGIARRAAPGGCFQTGVSGTGDAGP